MSISYIRPTFYKSAMCLILISTNKYQIPHTKHFAKKNSYSRYWFGALLCDTLLHSNLVYTDNIGLYNIERKRFIFTISFRSAAVQWRRCTYTEAGTVTASTSSSYEWRHFLFNISVHISGIRIHGKAYKKGTQYSQPPIQTKSQKHTLLLPELVNKYYNLHLRPCRSM